MGGVLLPSDGVGVAVTGRGGYRVTSRVEVHGRVLYAYHFESEVQGTADIAFEQQVDELMFFVGTEYLLPSPANTTDRVVIGFDLGRTTITTNTKFDSVAVSDQTSDSSAWAFMAYAGYDIGHLELRGGLIGFDEGGVNSEASYSVVGTLGYAFFEL